MATKSKEKTQTERRAERKEIDEPAKAIDRLLRTGLKLKENNLSDLIDSDKYSGKLSVGTKLLIFNTIREYQDKLKELGVDEFKEKKEFKFKIGDKVVGNRLADEEYMITVKGWIGKVTKIIDKDRITVRSAGTDNGYDYEDYEVLSKCFDLLERK